MAKSAWQYLGFVVGGFLGLGIGAGIAGSFAALETSTAIAAFGLGATVVSTLMGWFFPPGIKEPRDPDSERRYQDLKYTSFEQNKPIPIAHGVVHFGSIALFYGNNSVELKKTGERSYVIQQGKDKKTITQDVKDLFYSLDALLGLGEGPWEHIDSLYFNDQEVTHLQDDEGTGWVFLRGDDDEELWQPIADSNIEYKTPHRGTAKIGWYGEIGTANSVPNLTGIAKTKRSTYDTGQQLVSHTDDLLNKNMFFDPDSEKLCVPLNDNTALATFNRVGGNITKTYPPTAFIQGIELGVLWGWKNKCILVEKTNSNRSITVGAEGYTSSSDWSVFNVASEFDSPILLFTFDISHGGLFTVHSNKILFRFDVLNESMKSFDISQIPGYFTSDSVVGLYFDYENNHLYLANKFNEDQIYVLKIVFDTDTWDVILYENYIVSGFIDKKPKGLLKSGDLFVTIDLDPQKTPGDVSDKIEYEVDFTTYKDESATLPNDTENGISWNLYNEYDLASGSGRNLITDYKAFGIKLDSDTVFNENIATINYRNPGVRITAINKGTSFRSISQKIELLVSLDEGSFIDNDGPIVGGILHYTEDEEGNFKYFLGFVKRISDADNRKFEYGVAKIENGVFSPIATATDTLIEYNSRQVLKFIIEEENETFYRLKLYYKNTNELLDEPVINTTYTKTFEGFYSGMYGQAFKYRNDDVGIIRVATIKATSLNVQELVPYTMNRFSLNNYQSTDTTSIWKSDNTDPREIEDVTIFKTYPKQDRNNLYPWHNKATYTYTELNDPTEVVADPFTGYLFIRDRYQSDWIYFYTRWNREDWSYVSKSKYRQRIFTSLHSCAGWVLDLLTNERFGVGILPGNVFHIDINLASFEQCEGYCLEQVRVGVDEKYYYEDRYQVDGMIGHRSDALSQITSICSNFNAFLIESEGQLELVVLRPIRRIAKQFHYNNIKWMEDSGSSSVGWSLISPIDMPNEWITEFQNETDRFRWYPTRTFNEVEQQKFSHNDAPWRNITNIAREFVNRITQNIRMDRQERRASVLMDEVVVLTTDMAIDDIRKSDFVSVTLDEAGLNNQTFQIMEINEVIEDSGGIEYQLTLKKYNNSVFQNDIIIPDIDIQKQDFGFRAGLNVNNTDPEPPAFFAVKQLKNSGEIIVVIGANHSVSNIISADVRYKRGLIGSNIIDNYDQNLPINITITPTGIVQGRTEVYENAGGSPTLIGVRFQLMNVSSDLPSDGVLLIRYYTLNMNNEIDVNYTTIRYGYGAKRILEYPVVYDILTYLNKIHVIRRHIEKTSAIRSNLYVPLLVLNSVIESNDKNYVNENPAIINDSGFNDYKPINQTCLALSKQDEQYVPLRTPIYKLAENDILNFTLEDSDWEIIIASDNLFNTIETLPPLRLLHANNMIPPVSPLISMEFWNGTEWKKCWNVIDGSEGLKYPYTISNTDSIGGTPITFALPWWPIEKTIYQSVINTPGLLSYYQFGEKDLGGTIAFSEVNNYHGKYLQYKKELYFPNKQGEDSLVEIGGDDFSWYTQDRAWYIKLPIGAFPADYDPNTNEINKKSKTIEFWFKADIKIDESVGILFSIGDGIEENKSLQVVTESNNRLRLYTGGGSSKYRYITLSKPWRDGDKHHFFLTYNKDTNEIKTYLDGVLEDTWVGPDLLIPNDKNFDIAGANGSRYQFNGWLDEFAIYEGVVDLTSRYSTVNSYNETSGPWKKISKEELEEATGYPLNTTAANLWNSEIQNGYVVRMKFKKPISATTENISKVGFSTKLYGEFALIPESDNRFSIDNFIKKRQYYLSFIPQTFGPANQPFEDISRLPKQYLQIQQSNKLIFDGVFTAGKTAKADEDLPIYSAVGFRNGKAVLARANEDDPIPAIGITINSVIKGYDSRYNIAVSGATITNDDWNWVVDENTGFSPIYLDVTSGYDQLGGNLTQTPPANGIKQQLGVAISSNTIILGVHFGESHTHIYGEEPIGQINGVNTTFFTKYPYKKGTLRVYFDSEYSGGVRITKSIDNYGFVEVPDGNGVYRQFELQRPPITVNQWGESVNEILRVDYIHELSHV